MHSEKLDQQVDDLSFMNEKNQLDFESSWSAVCSDAQKWSNRATARCDLRFAEEILRFTADFCEQPAPTSDGELKDRVDQSRNLTMITRVISTSESWAAIHPQLSDRIWAATKAFAASAGIGIDSTKASLSLTRKVADIIYAGG